jgi:hypothetical protein
MDRQLKSIWREPKSRSWSFYCPLCKVSRKMPHHPKPGGPRHFIQVSLTAAVFTIACWSWFSWKGLVAFVPFWIAFEVAFRMRVRAALVCSQCGFDPFLYLSDEDRARRAIEEHWRRKFAEKGMPYPGEEPPARVESAPVEAEAGTAQS